MVSRIAVFSAMIVGLGIAQAQAARPSNFADASKSPASTADENIVLAQARDVEVYFDGNGNRVIIDAYTGEIIAVQPPRRMINRQEQRRALREREWRDDERYYLDDPEDMARLRRDQLDPRRYPQPPVEDYRPYDDGGFPPAPGSDFPDEQIYPDEGIDSGPQIVTREPVERRPLDGQVAPSLPPMAEPTLPRATIEPPAAFSAREDVAAIQVLMDRTGASPGVIDGKFGSNVDKALEAYRALTGENLKSTDTEGIKAALAASGGDPFVDYTITPEDAAGPFVAAVPADYSEKAQLTHLSYTSVAEMLAERFHMDEAYLKALNPEANFSRPGTIIRVANVGKPVTTKVQRIVADKSLKQVRAYDEAGKLVAAYPATIGSTDTPSPTGLHAVSRVALNPNYTYNPKLNFKQGNNDKILTIPPGPNGPVGSVWIALDKPTYGIHGTPDPSKIGKTESHGCVRLTNWDAQELAKLVSAGVMVEFTE
ncbi:L,D-transpeptidase [Pseudaminobacter arsenicus]|uniref:L,D-transpeptidase n=1 Tax=Borborobacter arsenicus TaxID=1851146 RepID=A0A432V6I7_9HYPH|nr:L,D-transpeptidase [Pseudaminobacter arsenicus]RUM97782.1 L,D-transpeptidase [Pseudaminobacter arsenicus]